MNEDALRARLLEEMKEFGPKKIFLFVLQENDFSQGKEIMVEQVTKRGLPGIYVMDNCVACVTCLNSSVSYFLNA